MQRRDWELEGFERGYWQSSRGLFSLEMIIYEREKNAWCWVKVVVPACAELGSVGSCCTYVIESRCNIGVSVKQLDALDYDVVLL